jgi:putative transposase
MVTSIDGPLVHHSGSRLHHLAIRYTERLLEHFIASSVGCRGDACENPLAETINGLCKAEVIHHIGPSKGLGT